MNKRLQDKVAVIVGGGQKKGETIGNGRAIALLFAREGARLLLVDRMYESAMETKKIIEQEGSAIVEVLEADVMHEASCAKIFTKCLELYGRVDIVVNNVGIGKGDGPLDKLDHKIWDEVLDVNLRGMFFVCKHVIPIMIKQQSGSIINISSIAAVIGKGGAAYCASKAGVNSLTLLAAMDNAKYGIRVNAIMPGVMNTPMAIPDMLDKDAKDDLLQKRTASIPLKGGQGSGWDTAYSALFLASDEAKFITAAILPVDGGASASAMCWIDFH